MIDLTGWTPHEGGDNPVPPADGQEVGPPVRVLIRGRPEHAINGGPKESGPSPSTAYVWTRDPAYPNSDIVAWRRGDDDSPYRSYAQVRADMGLGR